MGVGGDLQITLTPITETCLFKYTEKFTTQNESFHIKKKNLIFFIILLELPWRGGSINYPLSMLFCCFLLLFFFFFFFCRNK